jgi:hypothetical protein
VTRCDRAQCLRPVVGTLRLCRDGIRRAMCALHTIAELKRQRVALATVRDNVPALRPAIPAFRKRAGERSKAAKARHDRVAKRVLREHVVCDCTHFDGRLVRACARHAKGGR